MNKILQNVSKSNLFSSKKVLPRTLVKHRRAEEETKLNNKVKKNMEFSSNPKESYFKSIVNGIIRPRHTWNKTSKFIYKIKNSVYLEHQSYSYDKTQKESNFFIKLGIKDKNTELIFDRTAGENFSKNNIVCKHQLCPNLLLSLRLQIDCFTNKNFSLKKLIKPKFSYRFDTNKTI